MGHSFVLTDNRAMQCWAQADLGTVQAAAWQTLQTCEADMQLARLINREDQARHAQEMQDLQFATAMNASADQAQPANSADSQLPDFASCRVHLLAVSRVKHNAAGIAAQLSVNAGTTAQCSVGGGSAKLCHLLTPEK